MIYRNGFVSNSSSTSFIIEVKRTNVCKHCGRSDPDFIDLIQRVDQDNSCSDATKVEADGIENVIDKINEENNFYPENPMYSKSLIKKIQACKNRVAMIQLSYHDAEMQKLYEQGKNIGSIIELHTNGG